jgi:hypothetical protein
MFGTMLKDRAEAIWDGELVDVSALAQGQGWTCPVVLTAATYAVVVEGAPTGDDGAEERRRLREVAARAHRKVTVAKTFGRLRLGSPVSFRVELSADPAASEVRPMAVILNRSDDDGPVATIVRLGEQ